MDIKSQSHTAQGKSLIRKNEFFHKHKEEIFNSDHRFAVIYDDENCEQGIKYYDKIKDVYENHPTLNPNTNFFGNVVASLIDTWQIKNSPEFQMEQIATKKQKLEKTLTQVVNELYDLEEKERKLKK